MHRTERSSAGSTLLKGRSVTTCTGATAPGSVKTMLIEEITVTPFQQHTRIVACEETKQAICIDPGDEAERIVETLERRSLTLQAIALTHAHLDHVGAVAALKKLQPKAKINLHRGDEFIYQALLVFEQPPAIDHYWTDGEKYSVGKLAFEVLHCPGHTPGHVVLYEPAEQTVFVGDVLFAGSIGRTDLPGGSTEQLLNSIKTKLMTLPDDVKVYSGHGPVTTIGEERLTNPFLSHRFI
jgi:hydroxyacylglutathione hydrolase